MSIRFQCEECGSYEYSDMEGFGEDEFVNSKIMFV